MSEALRSRINWSRIDTIALTAITLVGGIVRLVHVARPHQIIFDETYYATDACWYVNTSPSLCEIEGEANQLHPPLGKWLIAMGIRIFGYDSLGWRISAVVAGTVTIALLYLLARKLLKSTIGASLAAGLLAVDLLHFVQSRVSMLDIFIPLFGVAAFLFLAYDRDYLAVRRKSTDDQVEDDVGSRAREGLLNRPWRIAAGASAGAATAVKWSGAFILFAVILLTIVWEVWDRRQDGADNPLGRALREQGLSIFLWLIVLPFAVYVFTYVGRLDGTLWAAPWSEGSWFRAFWDRHDYMYDTHKNLTQTHSYQSPPWSWLLLKRPVSYFYCADVNCKPPIAEGSVKEIFATGSPFVWWASILAIAYVAWRWVRTRNPFSPEGMILAGFVFTYAFWLLPFFNRPAVFIFYLLPAVPFMCLSIAYVATRIGDTWEARAAQAVFALGAVGFFVFYYPLLAGNSLSREEWEKRIWEFDNCDPGPGVATTQTLTETQDGETVIRTEATTTTESRPPPGWCWI